MKIPSDSKNWIGIVLVLILIGSRLAWATALDRAKTAYDAKDYVRAEKLFRIAAEQGDPEAQRKLGSMYVYGKGVPQDYAKAVEWYRKAAGQGNAAAQYNLGIMQERGRGVPRNYTEALEWYRKASDQGDAGAQFSLGIMHE